MRAQTIDEPQTAQLARSELLRGLDEQQLAAFLQLVTVVEIDAAHAMIVREGEVAENFYMILAGEAEVFKRESKGGLEFPIATLGPGDHFGETALFEHNRRTATIRARTSMTLVMLRTRDIRESPQSHVWLPGFLLNLARQGARRLDDQTNKTVEGLRAEVDGGKRGVALHRFVLYALVGLSLYAIALAFALRSAATASFGVWMSDVLYAIFGALLLWVMLENPSSRSFFGVRFSDDRQRELGETVAATGFLIGLATLFKFALIHTVPALRGLELLTPINLGFVGVVIGLGYVMLMALQEVCIRGALQSSLQEIFDGDPRRVVYAIVLSNALFAAFHAHVSPYLAIMVFVPGLVWGLLYARHRSLLGVTVSHVLVGVWALRVLGLGQILASF